MAKDGLTKREQFIRAVLRYGAACYDHGQAVYALDNAGGTEGYAMRARYRREIALDAVYCLSCDGVEPLGPVPADVDEE